MSSKNEKELSLLYEKLSVQAKIELEKLIDRHHQRILIEDLNMLLVNSAKEFKEDILQKSHDKPKNSNSITKAGTI